MSKSPRRKHLAHKGSRRDTERQLVGATALRQPRNPRRNVEVSQEEEDISFQYAERIMLKRESYTMKVMLGRLHVEQTSMLSRLPC